MSKAVEGQAVAPLSGGSDETCATIAEAQDSWLRPALITALLVGLAGRTLLGWQAPLWFDESFTATIATTRATPALWEWLTHEIGGPLFYLVEWLWVGVAGDSNVALRIPPLLASIAAPLVLLLWGGTGDRRVRWIGAALLALYGPAIVQGSEARCYALLTLLASLQAMAFLALMRAPDRRRALLWVGITDLFVLTHYHALPISGLQLLFLAFHWRRRAVPLWPALLLFLPLAAWMAVHLPFVLSYATSGATWYGKLSPGQIVLVPLFFLGFPLVDQFLGAAVALTLIVAAWRADVRRRFAMPAAEASLLLSAVGASLAVFIMGCVSASFTARYLIPYAPAVLLGLAFWLDRVDQFYARASAVLLLLIAILTFAQIKEARAHPEDDRRFGFNMQQPSEWIAERGATARLVYFWDSPTADFSDPAHMAQVGGYFLHRAGERTVVDVPRLPRGRDPFPALIARAGSRPNGALLWMYDKSVAGSRGATFPARLDRFPDWTCRDFGRDPTVVIACVPAHKKPAS